MAPVTEQMSQKMVKNKVLYFLAWSMQRQYREEAQTGKEREPLIRDLERDMTHTGTSLFQKELQFKWQSSALNSSLSYYYEI